MLGFQVSCLMQNEKLLILKVMENMPAMFVKNCGTFCMLTLDASESNISQYTVSYILLFCL